MGMLYAQSDHGIDQGVPSRILTLNSRWRQCAELGEFCLAHDRQNRVANFPENPKIVAPLAFEKLVRRKSAFSRGKGWMWELGKETPSKG